MARTDMEMCVTLEAGSDLSSSQFAFVAIAADGQIDLAGDGAYADGVLANDPAAAGRAAHVVIGGVTRVKVGAGGVTAGGAVASNASGLAEGAASGDVILGTALATGSSGEVVSILFQPRGAL